MQKALAHGLGQSALATAAVPRGRCFRHRRVGRELNRQARGRGTLMRHFLLFGPVAALAFGVGMPTAPAGLIPATGGTDGATASLIGTRVRTVTMAAITVAADEYGGATRCAQVAASGKVHWQSRPMGFRRLRPLRGILRVQRGPSGLRGAASGLTWRLGPVSRLRFHRPVSVLPHRQRLRYSLPRFACQTTIAAQSVRPKPCGRQTVKPA